MAIVRPQDIYGEVVFLGLNRDRAAGLETESVEEVRAIWGGFEGDHYAGITRPACSRVKLQYERGTEIANVRQVTLLSEEELDAVAAEMGLPGLNPEWLGANVVVRGVPHLTLLPPGARLIFEGGVSLAVDLENGPCSQVAEVIERHHPGKGMAFPRIARERRGVTGWVERAGTLRVGERGRLHTPPQRLYAPALKEPA